MSNLWKAPESTDLWTDTSTDSAPFNLVQKLTLHGPLHYLFIELNFFNLKLKLPSCFPDIIVLFCSILKIPIIFYKFCIIYFFIMFAVYSVSLLPEQQTL